MKVEPEAARGAAHAGVGRSGKALQRRLTAAFVAALAVVIALALVVFDTTRRAIEASRQVARTQEVLRTLDGVEAALATAQAAVRGFAITGDEIHLRDLDRAVSSLESRVQKLRDLTLGNDSQQRRWQADTQMRGIVWIHRLQLAR